MKNFEYLNYDAFKDNLVEQRDVQWLFRFKNNLGASVVIHDSSYGSEQGLFELTLIKWLDAGTYELTYIYIDEYIDVVEHLTNEKVLEYLGKIKAL